MRVRGQTRATHASPLHHRGLFQTGTDRFKPVADSFQPVACFLQSVGYKLRLVGYSLKSFAETSKSHPDRLKSHSEKVKSRPYGLCGKELRGMHYFCAIIEMNHLIFKSRKMSYFKKACGNKRVCALSQAVVSIFRVPFPHTILFPRYAVIVRNRFRCHR